MSIKILNVVGARPNFMKMAPLVEAMQALPDVFEQRLIHTGQHYDARMSHTFFEELGLPRPDLDLGVGSAGHAEQTARVMMAFERVCLAEAPDLVVVVGDVNSTLACALTAKKLGIAVAHVEAGLRSRDMTMPEEINRLCTDAIGDLLFTTDRLADDNLRREGVGEARIHFVGNVMIDTLMKHRELASRRPLMGELGLSARAFATLTLHRPSNVDDPVVLRGIVETLAGFARNLPVVFPVHPRTRDRIESFGLGGFFREYADGTNLGPGIWLMQPLGYLDFLHLNMHARMVITDSGGLQEETTVLGVPCVTLRDNTERPITCTEGTNRLAGNRPERIRQAIDAVLREDLPAARIPEYWDGRAAGRIVEVLAGSQRLYRS